MTRKLATVSSALVLFLVLAGAALAAATRSADDPGVTSTSVLLGATTPLSGPFSSVSSVTVGAAAYFKYVNASGGVDGRKITFKYLDDAYNPAQTVQLTRQLVEQDKVFAIFNSVGTEHNLQVRDYLNQNEVPQVFAASGSTTLGRDSAQYPYTIGFQPSYQAEGWVYGKYLARTRKSARIAVLFQNDDYGKDLLNGLKRGLQRSSAKVIAAQPYEPTASDVQSQVAKLKATGADTFAVFAVGKFAIQAYVYANRLGWRPKLVINNIVSSASNVMAIASEGGSNKLVDATISGVFLKDPTDPKWSSDAGIKLYRQILKRYAPGANANDPYHVYGMSAAYTLVEALKKAGKNLTRDGLMKAIGSLNVTKDPFMIPGIVIKTGAGDRFPIEQMLLQKWVKGAWKSFGGLWGYRATA
ncbi:MAG TPA: ABC transporter substrate-binding protein [Gaiellaceae bacterium]|nr:ABC transporter substrate-binding protein [Gaiellaceae bacterium]